MRYELSLLMRLIFIFIPVELFEFIFKPLTIYSIYYILSLFTQPKIFEDSILIGNTSLLFSSACIAGVAYFLLMLLIIFTKDLKFINRIYCFLIGSILILAMNIIRIIILTFILINYGTNLFDLVHLFFWSIVSGVYVAFVWIFLVYIFKIKSIPIYDDLKYLYNNIKPKKSL